jgi:hypothetical protein
MAGHYLRIQVPDMYTFAYNLVIFLTDVVGWEIAEDVLDSGDVRDVVFVSAGEPEVPNGFPRYIRIRNYATGVALYTYETFVDITTNTGVVQGGVYGINSTQGIEVVVVADLERVIITNYPYTGTNVYTGYVGRITPYHRANEHPYPNLVKSSQATARTWYYSVADTNCFMIGPHGAVQHYFGAEAMSSFSISRGTNSDRNGTDVLAAPVLVNTDADPQRSELVGEPRGVYRIDPEISQANTFLKIDGEVYVTSVQSGVHMVMGPVGTEVPSLVPSPTPVGDRAAKRLAALLESLDNPDAHWDETTIQSSGGTVTGWTDKSGNGWDLVPGAIAPLHLVADQNGLDTVDCFTGSGYMDLDVSGGAPFSGTSPGTFYMVLITDSGPGVNGRSVLDVTDGPYGNHHPWTTNQPYNDFGTTARRNWNQSPGSVVHGWHVFSGTASTTLHEFDINGVTQYSTTSNTVSWRPAGASPWVVGGGITGAYEGRIGEVRFYAAEHIASTRAIVIATLKTKWGIA